MCVEYRTLLNLCKLQEYFSVVRMKLYNLLENSVSWESLKKFGEIRLWFLGYKYRTDEIVLKEIVKCLTENNINIITKEVVENYVTLCPHCHRLIHLGEDVERKPALHNLYIRRKELLHKKGLDISEKELNEYYLIEN